MLPPLIDRFQRVRLLPLLLAGCLAFAGCADTTNMSPSQRALEQSKQRFATTTAEGAVAGALLGALVGGVAGGGRGALIGAAAGGVTGGIAGAMVAQNNYQRSHTEGNLQAAIAEANQQASLAQQDAAEATAIANEARAKTVQLRAQYRAGQITAAQYRASMGTYQNSLKTLQDLSKGQAEQIVAYRQNASTAGGSAGQTLRTSSDSIAQSKAAVDRSISDIAAAMAAEPG